MLLSAWSLEFRYVFGVGFDKDACWGIRIIKFILLPTFSSQLSFVLGNFNYFLTKQHVPECAHFPAAGQGVSHLQFVFCRAGAEVSADVEGCWHPGYKETPSEGQLTEATGAAI